MNARSLTAKEMWEPLISRNYGRKSELKYRNKLLILLAGIVGLREIELTLVTNRSIHFSDRRFKRVRRTTRYDHEGWI